MSPMTVLEWMYQDSDKSMRLDRKCEMYKLFQQIRYMLGDQKKRNVWNLLHHQSGRSWTSVTNLTVLKSTKYLMHRKTRRQLHRLTNKNNVIQILDRPMIIQIALGCKTSNILRVCRGKRKTAYWFQWKFATNTLCSHHCINVSILK